MRKFMGLFAAGACLVTAPSASAQDGDVQFFTIVNEHDRSIIGFQTDAGEGDGWSDNWLPDTKIIASGTRHRIQFMPEYAAGACEVMTRITFDDESVRDEAVDYCDLDNLNVGAQDQWTDKK